MNSAKTYLVIWLSGVIAGLVMVERWRRAGARSAPVAERGGGITEVSVAISASDAPSDKPPLSALIVAGVKADARRAQRVLDQVMPWGPTSAPSLAQLRRRSPALPSTDTVSDAPSAP